MPNVKRNGMLLCESKKEKRQTSWVRRCCCDVSEKTFFCVCGGLGVCCRHALSSAFLACPTRRLLLHYRDACGPNHDQKCGTTHDDRCGTTHGNRYGTTHDKRCGTTHDNRHGTTQDNRCGTTHGSTCGTTHVTDGEQHVIAETRAEQHMIAGVLMRNEVKRNPCPKSNKKVSVHTQTKIVVSIHH